MSKPVSTDSSVGASVRSTTRSVSRSAMVGGTLGLLMFVLGFLRWLKVGEGPDEISYSGFAIQMPTTAVIGFGLAAGLMALLGASERRAGRGVASAVPAALAATSLLLAVGIYLGKGAISPDIGSEVGVEIGLILGLVTALVQTIVLGMVLASRHDNDRSDDVQERSRTNSRPDLTAST